MFPPPRITLTLGCCALGLLTASAPAKNTGLIFVGNEKSNTITVLDQNDRVISPYRETKRHEGASGLMLGAVGMLLSSTIRQLENFAGIMNFVIFPMFFLSSALYPLWKVKESSELLYKICLINPFTYAVESIRFTLYLEANLQAVLIVLACALVSFGLAVWGYDPKQGIIRRAFP